MNAAPSIVVVPLESKHIECAVALQQACFPPPFDENLLWNREHVAHHLEVFPEGQFVALDGEKVIGSASSLIISESNWRRHSNWQTTVGGFMFANHDRTGTTLYGADISVHSDFRGNGVGRALYQARFDLVRRLGLARFGTACRMPDWRSWVNLYCIADKREYVNYVLRGEAVDRTLTPILRYGLQFVQVIQNYMDDEESGDAAALLEWTP